MRALIVILSTLACLAACSRSEPATRADTRSPTAAGDTFVNATPAPARPDARAEPPPPRRVPVLERRGDSEGPIPYRVVEPGDPRGDLPLVIALHGRGDTAEGFARLAMRLGLEARIIVAEAPLPFGLAGGRQWYDMRAADQGAAEVRRRVADLQVLIDKLAARHPEAGKPALYGFSQGAVVAIQAAREIPERLRAVAALSGYLATEEGAVKPTSPLPILITAGTKDGIVPQARSWDAAFALEKQGHAVSRMSFEGPHGVPPVVLTRLARFLADTE